METEKIAAETIMYTTNRQRSCPCNRLIGPAVRGCLGQCVVVALVGSMWLSSLLASGCTSRSPDPAQTTSRHTERGGRPPKFRRDSAEDSGRTPSKGATARRRGPLVKNYSVRAGAAGRNTDSLSSAEAMERVLATVQESVEFAPTVVVWLVDISPSAMQWGSGLHSDVRQFYVDVVPQLVAQQPDRLESALLTIGQSVKQPVELTSDPQRVVRAVDALRVDESGRELTFHAVRQALEAYVKVRVKERREVVLVILSDEAGDDWNLIDELVEEPRKYAIPVYVVGVPAPLGRLAALGRGVEATGGEEGLGARTEAGGADPPWRPILQGPESRYRERVGLRFDNLDGDFELLDSGFGPFALERLCRASGGAFLAVRRPELGSYSFSPERRWPTSDVTIYDAGVMRRYLPRPLDEAQYQALLASNRACMARTSSGRVAGV